MKKCLSDVCQDINILIQEKQMDVDGETVNLDSLSVETAS